MKTGRWCTTLPSCWCSNGNHWIPIINVPLENQGGVMVAMVVPQIPNYRSTQRSLLFATFTSLSCYNCRFLIGRARWCTRVWWECLWQTNWRVWSSTCGDEYKNALWQGFWWSCAARDRCSFEHKRLLQASQDRPSEMQTVCYQRYFHVAFESDPLCAYLNARTPFHLISLSKYWIKHQDVLGFGCSAAPILCFTLLVSDELMDCVLRCQKKRKRWTLGSVFHLPLVLQCFWECSWTCFVYVTVIQ